MRIVNLTVSNFYSFGGVTFCGTIESRCSFIIKDSLSIGSCTEWYTLQGVKLNLAWMDFCSLLSQKT